MQTTRGAGKRVPSTPQGDDRGRHQAERAQAAIVPMSSDCRTRSAGRAGRSVA